MDTNKLDKESTSLVVRAKATRVRTPVDFSEAGHFLAEIKAYLKNVDGVFDPVVKSAHESHKTAVAQKKKYQEPAQEAERIIKRLLADYHTEQERIRVEEEVRFQELARKKAEGEALLAAQAAEDMGDVAAAEEILSAPVVPRIVKLDSTVPMTPGLSMTDTWSYRIVNIGQIPREYMMPDEKKIGAMVRASKGTVVIPGVEVVKGTSVAQRS